MAYKNTDKMYLWDTETNEQTFPQIDAVIVSQSQFNLLSTDVDEIKSTLTEEGEAWEV